MFTSGITSIRKYTMSLLDKIDILITPNAYKKGKLFAALPSPTFGGELADDGDFADGSTAWTLNPGWSIGGNSARYDGNALGTSIAQNISGVTGGNRYTVTFEVTQNTGDQNNTISLGSTTLTNSTHLPLGCNTFTGVAGFGTALNIYGNSGELLIIRNLTVKQELTGIADLDFTRASAATRVDPLGFINYAGVLPGVEQVTNGNFQQIGPEEVTNGDFDQIGPEEVTNGDFDQIGPEEVSNGDFSQEGTELVNHPDFSSGGGWNGSISVAGGQGTKTSGGLAYQTGVITSGKQYKIVVDVASLDGATNIYAGGNSSAALSVGVQTIYMTGGSSNDLLGLNNGYSTGVGSVFNSISVKEVGQDWTGVGSNGWSIDTDTQSLNFTNASNYVYQSISTVQNKTYKVVVDVELISGTLVVKSFNSQIIIQTNTIGRQTLTGYFTEADTNTNFGFQGNGGTVSGKIHSVSVKEVGQDWTFGNGWSMGDGVAVRADESGNSPIYQSIPVVNGRIYQFSYTRNYISGGGQTNIYSKLDNVNYTTLGAYTSTVVEEHTVTGTFTAGFTGSMSLNVYGIGTFTGTLDNVSVKEVGQDWTFIGGSELTTDGARINNTVTGTNSYVQQTLTGSLSGKQFVLTYDVITTNGTTLALEQVSSLALNTSTTGINRKLYFTWDRVNNSFVIKRLTTGTDVTIDNVSVKEVFQGWTIGTSPELSLGSVTFTSNGQNLFQAWTEETGTTYYIQLEGEGPVRLRTGFTGIPGQMIDVTLPDIITVNTDANTNRVQIFGSSSGTAVLTNVSVVEGGEIDIPRIDYTGGGCPHILVEPQRTNNLTASQDLTDLFWNSINVETIVASTVLSPDGTTFGFKAIPSTSTSTHYVDYDWGFLSMPSGVEVTYSVFAKPFGYTNFQLASSSGMNARYQNFELTGDGVLGSGNVNGATIKKIGDWYRCTITEGTTSTKPRVLNIATPSSGLGRNPTFTGNGTDGVLLWGAQLEEGTYPTSYIPNLSTTSGSTVTRVQETYEKTGISNLINDSEGCVFGEGNFAKSDSGSSYFYFVSLSDGTPNNRLEIRQSSTNLQFLWRVATYQDNIITSGVDVSSNFKFAVSYSSANIKFYVNGNLIGTINTPTLWTANTLNRMAFDNGSGGDILSGKVKQLQIFKTALTDDELTILTGTSGVHFYTSYAAMASGLTYKIE